MAMFVINHKVKDFSAWKNVYDAHQATRNKFGIHDHFVIQSTDNGNDVTIIGEGTAEHLRDFLDSDELKNAMHSSGVIGQPNITIGDDRK
jgi:hypothetical protein